MARLRSFDFNERFASTDEIEDWFEDTNAALRLFYSQQNPTFQARFISYTQDEVEGELDSRLEETDTLAAFTLLTAAEAALRTDFMLRCIQNRSDPLSKHFIGLHGANGLRVSLESILDGWKTHASIQAHVIGHIKAAFNYRHWIAHGRYWVPTLGQTYDYFAVQQILAIIAGFPLFTR